MSSRRAVLAAALWIATVAAGSMAQEAAADETRWLCLPGVDAGPCGGGLETTIHPRDGSEPRVRADSPMRPRRVDCFYVYPTVSGRPTPNADLSRDPEVEAIARWQAQRFSRHCRVFAPIYRQRTVPALLTGIGDPQASLAIAYRDVRSAFRRYVRELSRGRAFVLIGHSQGARLLRLLVREEIDPRPGLRRRLVSALLIGGNVTVRKGRDRGGDFAHVPACRRAGQTGCVIAYSAFMEPPPADSRYGRAPADDPANPAGLPGGPGYEVLCTNPASLRGGGGRLHTKLRPESFPGLIGLSLMYMLGGPPPQATTPWVVPPDRYRARCAREGAHHVLMVDPIGDSRRIPAFPSDTWGVHIADVNLALGNLVAVVGRQVRSHVRYERRAGRLAAPHSARRATPRSP